MPKDVKKKKAEKKARVAQKQEKKATQKDKKQSKKPKEDDSDAEDADLDAILAEYQKQQEQFLKVTEVTCDPPSPRSSSVLVASPSNSSEIFLFGGEYYNGALASFFNDLYVYKINSDSWRRVNSPNSPLPRSGHAMCQGGNAGGIYLFGGEFSSPKQGTFYHYNDFWKLDPGSREWTKLEGKRRAAREKRTSHDLLQELRYHIWWISRHKPTDEVLAGCVALRHTEVRLAFSAFPPASQKPDARSSFSLLPHESGAVIYGGYSRVKASTAVSKTSKAGKSSSRVTMKPVVHQDTWFLRITPPGSDAAINTPPTVRWERRKRPVNAPNPARAGATQAYHKGRGVLFGGVHDVEESEEGIDSEFFNQLYAYNIDRNRFFQLSLRRPRTSARKAVPAAERGKRGRGKADEEELLRNLQLIENKTGLGEDSESHNTSAPPQNDDEEQTDTIEKPVMWEMPHPRFNAQLTVQDDTLYMFGGTFEKGDREYTFDEMLSIDLGKLDGVKEVFKRELEDWQGSEDEESEEDDEEDGSEGEDESDEEGGEPSAPATSVATENPFEQQDDPEPEMTESEQLGKDDRFPYPRPFESLRDFFARTSNEWQNVVLEAMKYERDAGERSVKEIRKVAFDRSEVAWWDAREEIQALEDEQEAAGIGEVVNLDDKGGGHGAGRRR